MTSMRIIPIALILLAACQSSPDESHMEQWKAEVLQTEADFAKMAADSGVSEAFLAYADSGAVLLRSERIVSDLQTYFKDQHGPDSRELTWTPDTVIVSLSGDLAYTYGTYNYKPNKDSAKVFTGIFHTIWKHQADGSWKYVWD